MKEHVRKPIESLLKGVKTAFFIGLGYLGYIFFRKTYDFSTLGVGGLESGKVQRKVPRTVP